MSLPILNEHLSYGKIPVEHRHKRDGLRDFFSSNWQKLTDIPNWDNINLHSLSVRTDHTRLIDAEITFTTTAERISLYYYYKCKGKEVRIPGFVVRDNHSVKTCTTSLQQPSHILKRTALSFNQMLTEKCDFDLPNFRCIPSKMPSKIEEVLKAMNNLRQKRIRIRLSPTYIDIVYLNNFGININILQVITDCSSLLNVLVNIDIINKDFEEIILINEKCILDAVDYEDLEKCRYSIQFKDTFDNESVQQCFEIFKNNIVSSVVMVGNGSLQINKAFSISPKHLLMMSQNNQKVLIEMAENVGKYLKKLNIFRPDNIISLKDPNNPIITQISRNKKFHNFSIVDDNRGTYLKLAKIVNCCLDGIEDEKLLSYEWLELIPHELLMDKEKADTLLCILQSLKNKGINFCSTNAGTISTLCTTNTGSKTFIELPVFLWLQIHDSNAFERFLKLLSSLKNHEESPFILFSSCLFAGKKENEIYRWQPLYVSLNQENMTYALRYFLKKNELPVVLNSGAHIMLGHSIWMCLWDLPRQNFNTFYEMVKCFENCITQVNQDNMRSIRVLPDREKAIKLAQKINKNLAQISEAEICHENLKIFPTDLWNAINDNQATYEYAIKMFELLKENELYWLIKLNGSITLMENLTVTITQLLSLNNENQKFKELKELTEQVINCETGVKNSLICEEEIIKENNRKKRVINTKISSYDNIIRAKDKLNTKGILTRIQPNGTIFLNDNLWVKAEDVLISGLKVVEISEKLKQIFTKNYKFQFGHPLTPIFTIFKSKDEELYQYCYNMCQYINENYEDISILYFATTNLFKFNEMLSIHPRSFFHLQNIDNVVKVLRKFKDHKEKQEKFNQEKSKLSKNEMYKKQKELENEEKQFCKELWEIKKEERVETDYIKVKCFDRISEIIQKPFNFARLRSIGNMSEMDENKPFHGLEDIQIQEEYIFRNGNTNGFVNIDKSKGTTVLAYNNKKIIDAIEMADKLDENFRCKNLSDFQSLIEILTSYDSFNAKRKALKFNDVPKEIENKELHEKIHWWLLKMEEIQSKQQKYKFGNALKALHHWFKHSEGFENLEHWYREIENFFENTNFEFEMDTQNGEFIGRRYENEKYFGVYSIAHEDAKKDNFVTTFWFKGKSESKTEKKKKECFEFTKAEECGKYLIITDTEFGNFNADVKYFLNDKITVKTVLKQKPNFLLLTEHINKGKYENAENVENLLLFLTDTVKNKNTERIQGKRKDGSKMFHEEEKDYEKCLDMLLTAIYSKFTSLKNIVLCYVDNTEQEKVDILSESEKCKLQEIKEYLVVDKAAAELKDFLEATFTPEINNL